MNDKEIDEALAALIADGIVEQLPNDRFKLTEVGKAWVESLLKESPGARELLASILDKLISERGGKA